LGLEHIGTPIPLETMLPAPAQGAIGIEVRANDQRLRNLVEAINHAATFRCVMAERALLAALGGDCRSAIAALATTEDDKLLLRAELYSPDGGERVAGASQFAPDDRLAPAILASHLLVQASPELKACFAG